MTRMPNRQQQITINPRDVAPKIQPRLQFSTGGREREREREKEREREREKERERNYILPTIIPITKRDRLLQ